MFALSWERNARSVRAEGQNSGWLRSHLRIMAHVIIRRLRPRNPPRLVSASHRAGVGIRRGACRHRTGCLYGADARLVYDAHAQLAHDIDARLAHEPYTTVRV